MGQRGAEGSRPAGVALEARGSEQGAAGRCRGQGESAGLHHPAYEFNDEAAPYGASFFARLVEKAQPLA